MSDAQLPLPLPVAARLGWGDFLVTPANDGAVATLRAWTGWPGRRLVLVGPARSGKTHLARLWAAETGARLIRHCDLVPETIVALPPGPVLVEDVDRALPPRAEQALFHLHNHLGGPLLLTARVAPAQMVVRLPDLASRLGTYGVARIGPPDDALLSSILIKHLGDRGLGVSPAVIEKLARRIERSYRAAEEVAAALDTLALARKKPVTGAMVDQVLGTGDEQI